MLEIILEFCSRYAVVKQAEAALLQVLLEVSLAIICVLGVNLGCGWLCLVVVLW